MFSTNKLDSGDSRVFSPSDFSALKSRLNGLAVKAESIMKAMCDMRVDMHKDIITDIGLSENLFIIFLIFEIYGLSTAEPGALPEPACNG